ncbi:WxL domain-containing protein [Enterococcus alishanensis]|uniref:WxL domain-containing protein n=1 Tax=Enterococcus alishanensis TaxID=1303817 RepID=A0ABS6T8G8_9ENTE|nr:WxL domain-containing protein [Enterococcus alishanensis]MBV7389173.1 WxL domain-containing protein [Enterococcus alishanensis]
MKKKALGYVLSIIGLSAVCVTAGLQSVEAVQTKTTKGEVTYTDGTLDLDDSDAALPDNLLFGSHEIQYDADKVYYATDDGTDNENGSASNITTGKVIVTDNRSSATNGWVVKVQQAEQFKLGTDELNGAVLSTYGNPRALTNITGSNDFDPIENKLELVPGSDRTVLNAVTSDSAKGTTELDLTQFTLEVPKEASKAVGKYESTINWTVTAAPAP